MASAAAMLPAIAGLAVWLCPSQLGALPPRADASSLACCLPNPLHRDPDWVNCYMASRRAQIALDAEKNNCKFEMPY